MWRKEEIIEEFRKRGMRITQQRLVIFDVIAGNEWESCKDLL